MTAESLSPELVRRLTTDRSGAALFSTERLEAFAEALAAEHAVSPASGAGARFSPPPGERPRPARELPVDRGRDPRRAHDLAGRRVAGGQLPHRRGPAPRIREDLPPGFYRELPKLARGRSKGTRASMRSPGPSSSTPTAGSIPRRCAVSSASISASSCWRSASCGRSRSPSASSSSKPAAPGGAHRRAAARPRRSRCDQRRPARGRRTAAADAWPILRALEERPLSGPFAVRLIERLREQDPAVTPAVPWLAERLAAQDVTADAIVRSEQQEQVATHVTVRNVITSMRLLSSVEWADFFESVSLVEEALREGTRVAEMDFATRDQYRRAVEELARGTRFSELEVTRRAVGRRARRRPARRPVLADPGCYLISRGRAELEKELRLPRAGRAVAAPRVDPPRHRRLHRNDPPDGRDPRVSRDGRVPPRRAGALALAARAPRPDPRLGARDRRHQPGRHRDGGAPAPAEARVEARRPEELRTLIVVPTFSATRARSRDRSRPSRSTPRQRRRRLRFALLSD